MRTVLTGKDWLENSENDVAQFPHDISVNRGARLGDLRFFDVPEHK
jgi:hypothetical protein